MWDKPTVSHNVPFNEARRFRHYAINLPDAKYLTRRRAPALRGRRG